MEREFEFIAKSHNAIRFLLQDAHVSWDSQARNIAIEFNKPELAQICWNCRILLATDTPWAIYYCDQVGRRIPVLPGAQLNSSRSPGARALTRSTDHRLG